MTRVGSVSVGALLALLMSCSADPSANGRDKLAASGPRPIAGANAGNAGTATGIGGAQAGNAAGGSGSAASAAAPTSPAMPATPAHTFQPKPSLDPNADFSWPETVPGGGKCQEGTYTGTFDCTFTDPNGLIPDVELSGPVTLTFMKSMDGEFLEITDGQFEALGNDLIGGKAKITGKLDCSSLMLAAMAVDGEWTIGDPNAPLIPGGGLTGDIMGTLDPASGSLSGQWNFSDPDLGGCPGTWTVMYTP
jgi:hypothetical protein